VLRVPTVLIEAVIVEDPSFLGGFFPAVIARDIVEIPAKVVTEVWVLSFESA
jgi:hypothetical protein